MKNFPKRLDSKTSCLRITVPENLDLALEGLIRKVLKEQPKTDDIYSFAADYFETLLKIRDKTGAKFTAAQLCPFHNDEDAHEMIKLAGTFSKPGSEKLGDSFSSKGKKSVRKKETVAKDQTEKNVRKTKPTERLKNEKVVPNKQLKSDLIKKKQTGAKSAPVQGKTEQRIARELQPSKDSDEGISEKKAIKEESDDEEFLASDPIKELVEKELMETKSNSKGKELIEKNPPDVGISESSEVVLTNKGDEEGGKLIGNINEKPEIKDTIGALEEESKASETVLEKSEEANSHQIKVSDSVQEIKFKSDRVDQTGNEEAGGDVEVDKEKIKNNEEVKNEKLEDVEAVNKEITRDLENLSKEKKETIIETDEEPPTGVEKTSQENPESTENEKMKTDKTSNLPKPLTQNKSKEEENEMREAEIDQQKTVKEKRDNTLEEIPMSGKIEKTSETPQDESKQDKNAFISNETDKNSTSDFRPTSREEEKNSGTSVEASAKHIPEIEDCEDIGKNQDQPKQPDNQFDTEIETKSTNGTTGEGENYETLGKNKEAEIPAVKENLSETSGNVGETNIINNQNQIIKEKKITEKETELIKKIEIIPKVSKTEAEEPNNSEKTFQSEQKSTVTEKTEDEKTNKTEVKQSVPESEEKILLNGKPTEDEKPENGASEKSEDEIKPHGIKLKQEEEKRTEESTADTNRELNDSVSNNEIIKPLEDKPTELSSPGMSLSEDDNPLQPSAPTNQNEGMTSEKAEKLVTTDQSSTNEGSQTDEKTREQEENGDSKSIFTENSQGTAASPQEETAKKPTTPENEQNVEQNSESHLATTGTVLEEKESAQQETTVHLQNLPKANNDVADKAKPDEPDTTDTLNEANEKEPKTELCLVTDGHQVPKKEEPEEKNHETEFETEVEAPKNNNEKVETHELRNVADTQQNPKENNMTSEKLNEELKPTLEVERDQNKDDPKLEEELCMVVDIQHLPKSEALDSIMSREESKPEAENIESKDNTDIKEPTPDTESSHTITVEESEKPNENKEKTQPSGGIQIKTIQTHYYDTLQVPKAVTKEYRVHSVAPLPMNALLSSFQPNNEPVHELFHQEKQTEGIEDVNMNVFPSSELKENVSSSSPPTEPKSIDFPTKSSKPDSPPLIKAITQNELELETQKSDSEDLLDITTPTSDYSLNLSEISWQTVNVLFLDSERRYSSLEKEGTRYATPNTSKTLDESDQLRRLERKEEVEEIIHKSVIHYKSDAVPIPPREAEEINEESNTETSENLKEKKNEDKQENESSENSTDSNNGKSLESNTPIISVEVKTIIETQVLDDEEEDGEERHKEKVGREDQEGIQPDMEIKIETTIEIPNERTVHSKLESPEEEKKLSDGNIQEQNDFKSTQTEDKNQHDKGTEDSLTEQISGREGSTGESDSTSSAATEIKRTDSIKRNFSSTRSLLLTQSLDFGKKNPLMKTRSLSTFRHGVTDFEVWNTIEKELEEAATKIQSKFRGYKTRKKLQRENAVHITTEESSISTTPVEPEIKEEYQQSTGEFHDSVVLSEHPR